MWHETSDVEQWLAATADLLLAEPGRFSIALTVAQQVREGRTGVRLAWWSDGTSRDVTGAAVWNPPFPVLVAVAPQDAVGPLADLWQPDAVSGETATAVQLAALLAHRAGGRARLVRGERLFRLGALTVPEVSGEARTAGEPDVTLVLGWFTAFLAEAGLAEHDLEADVRARVARGSVVLWEDAGQPCAMAGAQPPSFGAVRIGPVYTPPELRGRGYGAAATGEATLRALAGGHEVVLYTDLTNRTANALYPRLGFVPVSDRAVLEICSP